MMNDRMIKQLLSTSIIFYPHHGMSYNNDEDSDKKGYTDAKVGNGLQEMVTKINEALQALERTQQAVGQKVMKLRKSQDITEQKQLREEIKQQFLNLERQQIPNLNSMMTQFDNKLKLNTPAAQKQQFSAILNRLRSALANKQTSIRNMSLQFNNTAQKAEAVVDDEKASLVNFQMNVISEEINEEFEGIKHAAHETAEINHLMQIMAAEVNKADAVIDTIEGHVIAADEHVEKATKNLVDTRQIQKSKNKWSLWAIGGGIVGAVVLLLLLKFAFKVF